MDFKKIIYNVATALYPVLAIKVNIVSVEDIPDAHFVVASICYPDRDMLIPFVISNDDEVYIPFDWESVLPIISENIYTTKWVKFTPNLSTYPLIH